MNGSVTGQGLKRIDVAADFTTMSRAVCLRRPAACPQCGPSNVITLEHTMDGDVVPLAWRCSTCDHHWPVADDAVERRRGIDRRRDTDGPPQEVRAHGLRATADVLPFANAPACDRRSAWSETDAREPDPLWTRSPRGLFLLGVTMCG